MRRTFFLVFIIWFGLSCSDDEGVTPDLIGTWKLTEVLLDPGDGSGTFSPVQSDKTVTFFENGTVISNATLCNLAPDADALGEGVYSLQDSTITPTCPGQDFVGNIFFEIEGENLILYFLCIEPCAEKYVKQ